MPKASSNKVCDFGSNNRIRVAVLGVGNFVHRTLNISPDSEPDTRITATPDFPMPLARAKIVPDFIM